MGYTRSMIRVAKTKALLRKAQLHEWTTGMLPCDNDNCPVCPFAFYASSFSHPLVKLSCLILSRITCNSLNVIYLIRCSSCGACYVGQTGRSLKHRIQQHLASIRGETRQAPLHQHFRNSCGLDSFSFHGIDLHPDANTRKIKEAQWIRELKTGIPRGLNVITAEASTANLILPFSRCSVRVASAIRQWCTQHTSDVTMRAAYTRSPNLGELLSRGNR